KIALDDTDDEWLSAMIIHYGEERGRKLLTDIAAVLKPVMVDGHLALARSVGAGEYWLAVHNYASFARNVQLSRAGLGFWGRGPGGPLSRGAGRACAGPPPPAPPAGGAISTPARGPDHSRPPGAPTPPRHDVPVNPAYVSERLKDRKIIATIFGGDEQKKWQGL